MTGQDHATCLDVVLFTAGGWRIGVEAHQVSSCRRMSHGEDPGNVTDLELLLGLPVTPDNQIRLLLEFIPSVSLRPWRVTGPVELRAFPATTIHPLPTLLAVRSLIPGLRALAMEEDGITLLLDPGRIASPVTESDPPKSG
ncbi:MAG: hypothetical protein HQL95_02630 [Magnetococcales bacterium]|nr:hypothetical protein [Magnetococcales bacterium]